MITAQRQCLRRGHPCQRVILRSYLQSHWQGRCRAESLIWDASLSLSLSVISLPSFTNPTLSPFQLAFQASSFSISLSLYSSHSFSVSLFPPSICFCCLSSSLYLTYILSTLSHSFSHFPQCSLHCSIHLFLPTFPLSFSFSPFSLFRFVLPYASPSLPHPLLLSFSLIFPRSLSLHHSIHIFSPHLYFTSLSLLLS